MNLEPVIGLEIHIQLKTKTKMFCPCDNGGEDKTINTCICEICMGHPGVLPVMNKHAIECALKAIIALHCEIPAESKFDRKHYFYPDLPKGYQISQYDQPLGIHGYLEIDDQKIRIHRIHVEEDAAKLLHPEKASYSVVDYNRAGTPLIEIVTEPDITAPRTAGNFLRELRSIMRTLHISDADMEKGHLRCDANISLRPKGETKFYTKTEIKNLNSFKAVEQALAYEIKRQTLLWEQETLPHHNSTRGWDDYKGITVEHREKEDAHDYRYFPEPDIPPLYFDVQTKSKSAYSTFDVTEIERTLPELPQAKRERFQLQYGFSISDATLITRDYGLAKFTEQVMSELLEWLNSLPNTEIYDKPRLAKLTANWLLNNLTARIDSWDPPPITAENFAEFIALIVENKISSRAAQNILAIMIKTERDPGDILHEENLEQIDDASTLNAIVEMVVKANPEAVKDYKSGKENVLKFLMGMIMLETKGSANPKVIQKLLGEYLSN